MLETRARDSHGEFATDIANRATTRAAKRPSSHHRLGRTSPTRVEIRERGRSRSRIATRGAAPFPRVPPAPLSTKLLPQNATWAADLRQWPTFSSPCVWLAQPPVPPAPAVDEPLPPVEAPAVPVEAPAVPVEAPAVPVEAPAVPEDAPAVPVEDAPAVPIGTTAPSLSRARTLEMQKSNGTVLLALVTTCHAILTTFFFTSSVTFELMSVGIQHSVVKSLNSTVLGPTLTLTIEGLQYSLVPSSTLKRSAVGPGTVLPSISK